MVLPLLSTIIHYHFFTIRAESDTADRYDTNNSEMYKLPDGVTRRLTVYDLLPVVPTHPPPLLPHICKQLRPFLDKCTIWRKGSSPYQVDAMWQTDRVVLFTVYSSVEFGMYIHFVLQVRLHNTRPIGWFENDTEAVVADCPPGRANTMYLYNTQLRHGHSIRWFCPKWFKNHSAKIFYMVLNHELRYWKGNLTLPPRKDIFRLVEEQKKKEILSLYTYFKNKEDSLLTIYSTLGSSRKPRTKFQHRKRKEKKTMNISV